MNIIVTGPESSGTRWVTSLISFHPDVGRVFHHSFPEGKPKGRHWPDLRKYRCPVVVCVRDRTATTMSQQSLGWEQWDPPACWRQALDRIEDQLVGWPAPIAVVGYESLIGLPRLVFRQTLEHIGLDADCYEYERIDPQDGNAKYFEMAAAG